MSPTAPTVVLVHGLVISSRYMVPTAEQLAYLCRVYAVDLPGYGKSYEPKTVLSLSELADALAGWMTVLGLAKAHLVANSFGCQILAEFALRHPERVDRLVFQGPTIDPAARSLVRQLLRLMANSRREHPSLGRITLVDYRKAGLRRAWATIKMALADPIEAKLPAIQAPTLVVRGEKDPVVPQGWAEKAARLLPRGELRVVADAAHTLNYSAPEKFVAAILPFLHSTDP
jgi:pimeloyl-ACP methyl ester carboxylesterase